MTAQDSDAISEQVEAGLLQERLAREAARLIKPARITSTAQLDDALSTLRSALDQIDAIVPDQQNAELRQELAERLRVYEAKAKRQEILEETRFEVTRRLQAADRQFREGGTAQNTIERYRDAVNYVDSQRKETSDWDPSEIDELDQLKARASGVYQAFAQDHEMPTTRLSQEEVAALVIRFVELEEKDPNYPVTYFSEARIGAITESMPVSQALRNARFILRGLWLEKIEEYLREAKKLLDQPPHSPREALAWIERSDQLPGRDDPDIGVRLAEGPLDNINRERKRAEAAVKALEQAESELRLVQQALSPPQPDALTAQKHWQQARNHYPYGPNLDDLQKQIAEAARREIPPLLAATKSNLESEVWGTAGTQLDRLEDLFALLPTTELMSERADYNEFKTVYELLYPLIGETVKDNAQRRDRLHELQSRYRTNYWPGWPQLQQELTRLEELRNLDTLRNEINNACQPDVSTIELQSLIDSVNDILNNPPSNTTANERSDLPKLLNGLVSWQGYASARDELAKAPKSGASITQSPEEFSFEEVADLHVAEKGLQAARKDSGANKAAEQKKLASHLQSLQQNNTRAKQVVEEIEAFLESSSQPNIEELKSQRDKLIHRLRLPSSYRHQLLELFQRVSNQLTRQLGHELDSELEAAEPYYETLAIKEVNRLLRELRALAKQSGSEVSFVDSLEEEALCALAFARAHQTEKEVATNYKSWDQLKEAWMTAQEKAEADSTLSDYAYRRARIAHKYDQFEEADSIPEVAEQILRQLTEDPMLKDDWEVWYRYGDHLFEQARQSLSPDLLFTDITQSLPSAGQQLTTARHSLGRARSARQGKRITAGTAIAAQTRLEHLLEVIPDWARLQRALTEYWDALEADPLTHAGCMRMLRERIEATEQLSKPAAKTKVLNLPDVNAWHDRLWRQYQGAARVKLDQRLQKIEAEDILERFDALLGMAILFPDDATIAARLRQESQEMLSELQKLVDRTNKDYSGQEFSRRYLLHHRQSPEPKDFVELQLEDANVTKLQLTEYRETLNLATVTDFPVEPEILREMDTELESWLSELNGFRSALVNAQRLAEDGLSNPLQFDMAKYILRKGTSRATDLAQVPEEFINANHPSYRHVVDSVERDANRRDDQEALLREIESLIEREQNAVQLALRWRDAENLSDSQKEEVEHIIITLRELSGKLRDMQEKELGDPTFLQQHLEYHLPERTGMYYRSVTVIRPIIQQKLDQYETAKKWLEQWRTADGKFRNIISWPKQKQTIIRERDSGPDGLRKALFLCRSAHGDDEHDSHPNNPAKLQQALRATSLDSMIKTLQESVNDRDFILYGATEALNQRRLEVESSLKDQIAENEQIEVNLKWRIQSYQTRWDKFSDAKARLMAARKPLRSKWQETDIWKEYQNAAQDFCEICPSYVQFTEAMNEVERKTGLATYCNDIDNR